MKISHFSSFSSIIANATSFKRYKSCIYKCLQTQAHEIEPSIYIVRHGVIIDDDISE